jgi:hypothetical protein
MNKTILPNTFMAILGLLLLASQAISGSQTPHLQPEDGAYGFTMLNPYYQAVSERFLSSSPFHRKCQAIFLPSFINESAVYLKYEKDSSLPIVVSLKFEKQLWYEMQRIIGGKPLKPEIQRNALSQIQTVVNRLEAPLDTKVAAILEETWEAMLMRVHYPEKKRLGTDGENYHFANFSSEGGYRTGKVWSPAKETPTYELVKLAEALREYPSLPETNRQNAVQAMLKRAQDLLSQLKESK